ncbi:hypothetical protein RvY_15982-3 [Ramazzottius varieornatus]|uniref:Uncharacterized protein n=1 Tax=Ramazzottius varieornatus TaxID=947166 RepID=A0A1D1W1E0_RAMVA|nr:hypothetical protein RvY_15982-3 [Ramazzottius varieornatus]
MAAFSGLENTSPRIPPYKLSDIPPVGTYETDKSTIVAPVPLAGIYPPFGSYEARDTTGYVNRLPGHEGPDALYDPGISLGKSPPEVRFYHSICTSVINSDFEA